MKNKELLSLIKSAREKGIEVHYGKQNNGHIKIHNIGMRTGTGAGETTVESALSQAQKITLLQGIAKNPLSVEDANATPKRPYTYHTTESLRRHLQAQEKKITKTYKNPIAPTKKVKIERISKSGNKYSVYKEVQQVDIESQFRSVQRRYNKTSKEYQAKQKEFDELTSRNPSELSQEEIQRMNDLENELEATPEVIGKMKKSRFKEILETEGEKRAREYLQTMSYRARGEVPVSQMVDLIYADENFRLLTYGVDLSAYITAFEKFWARHSTGIKWADKKRIIDKMYGVLEAPTQDGVDELTDLIDSI